MDTKERANLESELNNMTMKDLVKSYNLLIESNKDKLTKPFNPVKKFASKKVGSARIMKVLTDLDRTEYTVDALEGQGEPEAPKENKPEAPKENKPEASKEDKPEAPKEDRPKASKEDKPEAPKEDKPEASKEDKPEAPKEDKPEAPAKPTEPNPDYYINEKGLEVIKGLTFGLFIKRGIILGIDREKLCKESLRLYTLMEEKDFEGAYMWYSFLLSSGRIQPTINGKEVK